jgi:hypothetical protein
MDFDLKLTSITIKKPSAPPGPSVSGGEGDEDTRVTYHRGDPEFDRFEHAHDDQYLRWKLTDERGLPKNFMVLSTGTSSSGFDLGRQIWDIFEQFYRGQTDAAAIEQKITYVVEDLKTSYINKGFDPADFMQQLIENVYDSARMANISGASVGSWYDGREVIKQFVGPDEYFGYYVYYDAKYYYQSEAMKDTLQDISWKLAEKHGVTELNLPTSYSDNDPRKWLYENYNTTINDRMRNDQHIGNFLVEDFAPPKDFRFFYRMNGGTGPYVPKLPAPVDEPEAAFDALLCVWSGDWSFMGRVPVRMDPTRYPVSVNAYELVSRSVRNIPPDIAAMLENMDFYAQNRGLEYERVHPRRYH